MVAKKVKTSGTMRKNAAWAQQSSVEMMSRAQTLMKSIQTHKRAIA